MTKEELKQKILKVLKVFNGREEAIFDICWKENAELKKQLEMSNKVYNDNLDYSHHIEEQLTKATELLRKLVLEVTGYEEIYGYDTCEPVQEAEQFLRETDIDNAIQKANEGLDLDKIAEEVEQDIKEQKVK